MQYYPIVRRLYLLYGFLRLVQGQSTGQSILDSTSASSEVVLASSNAAVSSSLPRDTSIAALTSSTTSTPSLNPETTLSDTGVTSSIEQASSTISSQTERDTFSSLSNTLTITISTTSSSTPITSPKKVSETSESSDSQEFSSASSLDISTTISSTAKTTFSDTHLYQTSQSQTVATNTALSSNSGLSASTNFVVTTSQPGTTGASSAFDTIDSDSSFTSSGNTFTSSSSMYEGSSIFTTYLGSTTSAISTERLFGSNTLSTSSTQSLTSDTFHAFTSISSSIDSETAFTSLISPTSTESSFSSEASFITIPDTSNTQGAGISTSTPEATTSDINLRILNVQASSNSAAISTESAATSTESAATSTESAATSTESAPTLTQPVATSIKPLDTSTESAATSIESAPTLTQPVATSIKPLDTSTESAATSIESAVTSTESDVTSTESAVTSTGSAVTSTESAVTSTESAVTSTESAVTTTESAATSTESAVASTESAATLTELVATSIKPLDTSTESAATSTESAVTSALTSTESAATSTGPLETSTESATTSIESSAVTSTESAAISTESAQSSTDPSTYLVFTLTSTPITSTMSISNLPKPKSDFDDTTQSISSYTTSYESSTYEAQESSGSSVSFTPTTFDVDTFTSSFPALTSKSALSSFTEVDITSETSLETSITTGTTNTPAALSTSSITERYILSSTASTIDSSFTTPAALSTASEASSYSSLSQDDVTFTTSTPVVILDSSTYSTGSSTTSDTILTFLTSSVPIDTSIFSTTAIETQASTALFSTKSTASQTSGSLLESSTIESANILISSSFTYQEVTSSESLHEETSVVVSMPMSSPSSTDQEFSIISSGNPISVQETTLTYRSSSPVYFSGLTQETSSSTNSIVSENALHSNPSSLVVTQSNSLRSDSAPVANQNDQSSTSSASAAPVDTIRRSQTTISSPLNTASSPNFQSIAESPSSTNASPAKVSTTLAPSKTTATADIASTHWLPTAIVVQSSLPSTYSSKFNPSVTATLPHIIAPPTPVVPVANSTIITVGFKVGLNYEFLINNPLASAQIFNFLPSLLAYPFQIDDSQKLAILYAKANYYISSEVKGSTTVLSPEQSSDASNNIIRSVEYSSVNISSIKVIQIIPLVVSGRDYLISVAEVYFPSDYVSALQTYVLNANSSLYDNPSQTLSALADLMDPSISLTSLLGYANGSGNAGNSGSSSTSSSVVAAPQNNKNNDDNTGSLEASNSTSRISFSITKRLLIYLTCLASGTLLWILLILFVYKLLYGKKRIEEQVKSEGPHMFYEKRLDSVADITSARSTNSTIHSPAMNEKCDFPKNEREPTSSELNFEIGEDLIITGENTVYSTVHGLEYFVDEDGSFYYAGAVNSNNKEDEIITEGSGYTENINDYLYSANEDRSAVTIGASSYEIGSLEVDEDGNFVLPVTNLEKELGGIDTDNSDTVESYNNNNLYKLRKTLLSDEMDNNGNIMSDNVAGGPNSTNSYESNHAHFINENSIDIGNSGNNSKKNISSSSNSDSNGLMYLPMDIDNFDEYMYQERDEHFQGHLDVEIDDIDDDHVADVQIDELDELDEEMYKRLSKIMTQKHNSMAASNFFASRTNSNTLDDLSASAVASTDDLDAKGFLQKGAGAVHNDTQH